jgi:hypothetical protein
MIGFVDRYAKMAGRACCCGRSWEGLNRSLARRGDDAADDNELTFIASECPEGSFADADRQPDETTFASTSSRL